MTGADIDRVCLEWWTGLTAEGQPAEHSEWPYRAQGTLPRVEQLAATLSTKLGSDDMVRVSLARGLDDETDVRIEVETAGLIEVYRWRPAEGSLDAGALWGGRTLSRQRSPEARAAFAEAETAARGDSSAMTLVDVRMYLPLLKHRRKELLERLEALQLQGADTTATEAALSEITTKIAALFARNTTLNEERHAIERER